jgi:hypothetical protein
MMPNLKYVWRFCKKNICSWPLFSGHMQYYHFQILVEIEIKIEIEIKGCYCTIEDYLNEDFSDVGYRYK